MHDDRLGALRSFDRTRDVPKLVGCNTRNVPYRWDIYERHLSRIPQGSRVLDYGAGSLRETHELATRGFHVTAVDIDIPTLHGYAREYDWSAVRFPALADRIPSEGNFHLITACDVIEHLEDPVEALAAFRSILDRDGLVFCTVPNRRSLPEMATRIALHAGRKLPPGEAHLQFKSPGEWRAFFESNGFKTLDHDMAIGCAVNTWYWSAQLPANALAKMARKARLDFRPDRIVKFAAPVWAMRALDKFDRMTKPVTRGLFGWNLFVLHADKRTEC